MTTPAPGQAPREVGVIATTLLGLGLLVLGAGLILLLFGVWPLVEPVPSGSETASRNWSVFGQVWTLSADAALLLLVVVVSMLGSFVHAATSFATYVGNRRLYASWVWWYLLRVAIGAALALILYFVVRGGLFSGTATTESLNPYGIAAIAGLTGLFSKQATDKLREVFDTVLSTTGPGGDAERADKVTNPEPVLDSISPGELSVGRDDVVLTLTGQGLDARSKLLVRRLEDSGLSRALPLAMTTEGTATARLPGDMREVPGVIEVVVLNPDPGGGQSEPRTLIVLGEVADQGTALDEART